MRGAVVGIGLLIASLAGCKHEPLPITLEPLPMNDGCGALFVRVTTEPGAEVDCEHCGGPYVADAKGVAAPSFYLDPSKPVPRLSFTVSHGFGRSETRTIDDYKYTPHLTVTEGARDAYGNAKSTIKCCGRSCEGSIDWTSSGGTLTLSAEAGASVAFGGRKETVASTAQIKLAMRGALTAADREPGALFKDPASSTAELPLRVVFSDGVAVETKLGTTFKLGEAVRHELARGVDTPLLFEGEAASGGGARSLVLLSSDGTLRELLGKPARLRDLDLVAVATTAEKRTGDCGNYNHGSDVRHITVGLYDQDVAVFERRTGKSLGKRHFAASGGCPDSLTAFGSNSGKAEELLFAEVDTKTIVPWVSSFLKAR